MFLITLEAYTSPTKVVTLRCAAEESSGIDTALRVAKWLMLNMYRHTAGVRPGLVGIQIVPSIDYDILRDMNVYPLTSERFLEWAKEEKDRAP